MDGLTNFSGISTESFGLGFNPNALVFKSFWILPNQSEKRFKSDSMRIDYKLIRGVNPNESEPSFQTETIRIIPIQSMVFVYYLHGWPYQFFWNF